MMKHKDFRKAGIISVWVGDFRSEIELDNYINSSRNFEEDFGFELKDRDMPETSVEPEPAPISRLVDGFSWSNFYAQSIRALAEKQGIERATTLVVFFNFEYLPERARAKDEAPLKFLGTVRFSPG